MLSRATSHLDFFVDGMTVKPGGPPCIVAAGAAAVRRSLLTALPAAPPAAAEGVIPNTGHFHVSIDSKSFPEGEAIPFDATQWVQLPRPAAAPAAHSYTSHTPPRVPRTRARTRTLQHTRACHASATTSRATPAQLPLREGADVR